MEAHYFFKKVAQILRKKMKIDIIKANYLDKNHAKDISFLMNEYAMDPMGGGKALHENVKNNLANELSKLPHAFTVVCYINGNPAGLVNCFEAFSTFACKPLVNIHDVIVLNEYRRNGINQKMLEKVEDIAVSKGCCKLTLEVLSENKIAKKSYESFGFSSYELDPKIGSALFWQKEL
jgi:ribosomal protein S18 acetylase RimI-like enzyme